MPEKTPTGEAQSRTAQEGSPQPRIFLAHASEDKAQVRQLYDDLKARGFAPWLDEVDLIPGQVWGVEIPKAIRQAGLFLACLSNRSVAKQGYVQNEFRTALTTYGERPPGSIWLIPVKLDDCEIPDLQIPDRGLSLRDIHWLDLAHERGFERLISAIELALPKATSTSAENDPETLNSVRGEGRQTGVIDVARLPDAPEREPRPDRLDPALPPDAGDEAARGAEPGSEALTRRAWFQQWSSSILVGPGRWVDRIALVTIGAMAAATALVASGVFEPSPDPAHQRQPGERPAIADRADPIDVGDVFRDCDECPEMVVVPAGSFMMGSPVHEEGRFEDEGPQREVTIREPFAIGKYEVTFDEWDACVIGGGCEGDKPNDRWGRGQQPVINVSWDDAQAYVSWLSGQTGEAYRLPSEAEWEYAARAGTTTRYSWGDGIKPDNANYGGTEERTARVGSYPANAWGLHDMHGNVWEWVEDCWNDSYTGAPEDGSAWTTGDCSRRVVRGGSWSSFPGDLRSACRSWVGTFDRGSHLGFRVARTLTP